MKASRPLQLPIWLVGSSAGGTVSSPTNVTAHKTRRRDLVVVRRSGLRPAAWLA